MVQMEWHDGSMKNVHIDPVVMFNYQHYLRDALQLYTRRLNWLQFQSRKLFGTLAQKRYILSWVVEFVRRLMTKICY